jgi:hypothetical protein
MNKITLLDNSVENTANTYTAEVQAARKAWKHYNQWVSGSFPELRDVAARYVFERTSTNNDAVPLNALVPYLLAEPFEFQNTEIQEQVTLANLCFEHFTQALDDSTDEKRVPSARQMHLSHHLLAKGFLMYLQLSSAQEGFAARLESYFEEAMEAERFLWRHKGRVMPYTEGDFAMIGRRCALFKASAAIYADLTKNWGFLAELEVGLDAAATGIQLVDDLIDWQGDFTEGYYTYPAVRALEICEVADPTRADVCVLESAIFHRGPADELLDLCHRYFAESRSHFSRAGAFLMVRLIDDLLSSLGSLRKRLVEIKKQNSGGLNVKPGCLTDLLRRAVDLRLLH